MKRVLVLTLSIFASLCMISCDDDNGSGDAESKCDVSKCEAPDNATAKCVEDACDFVCNKGYEKDGDKCKKSSSEQGDTCDASKCEVPENATAKCVDNNCDFDCNNGYERDGDKCKKAEQESKEPTCDPNVKDDVYTCQGNWRVVCKEGKIWIDDSENDFGTLDCATQNQVCAESLDQNGVVFDSYCAECTKTNVSMCKVKNADTMIAACEEGGFTMSCGFECKEGYKKNDAGDDCVAE